MKKNIGTIDRLVRIFLAVVFYVLIFTKVFFGAGAIITGILGGVFLLTGIFGFCPTYTLFGLHTLRTKSGVDI